VVALGGNALLERGEVPEAEIQEKHVAAAVEALVPLARDHDLLVTHGNGPQVGLLALESARDPALPRPYPFDVLGAQTQGMIGYFLLQAFENALPGQEVVSLVCQTLVDPADPAFAHPTKFVGPVLTEAEGHRVAQLRGWDIRPDGNAWRRVVPSPEPLVPIEMPTIRMLVGNGAIVICSGGGGIPVCRGPDGLLHGVERQIPTLVRNGTVVYTRADVPDSFAYDVAKSMDQHQDTLEWTNQNFFYDIHHVAKACDVPLHPGAAKYYREMGYMK